MSTIKDLQARAYKQSADKGFHDNEPGVMEAGWVEHDAMKIALMHSELSEALEELRSGRRPNETHYPTKENVTFGNFGPHKPEGVPSELADVVIRVMDYCEARGIDLEAMIEEKLDYNATRGHKHGGKAF